MRYKFYKESVVQKARGLRKKGFSGEKIARKLNITKTTALRWCVDIPSQNIFHVRAEKRKNKTKERGASLIGGLKIGERKAKILTSILYWCEGNKYPSSNFIAFCNSDTDLVETFLRLFRLGFHPDEKGIRVHLQIHDIHNKEKIISFWSKILEIPGSQFLKPTITKPTKNMKRRDYRGTCTIRYYDVSLLIEITGIYKEFSKKITKVN